MYNELASHINTTMCDSEVHYFQGFERQRQLFVYSANDSLPLLTAVLLVGDTYIFLSVYLELENH